MRNLEIVAWLETVGMRLEPAGSAWQEGTHSKHLQTLKGSMNLVCMELGNEHSIRQLLALCALCLSAKATPIRFEDVPQTNDTMSFGRNHSRVSPFLEQTFPRRAPVKLPRLKRM